MKGRVWSELLVAAALSALMGLYVSAGVRGTGFGSMWDEGLELEGLRHSVQTTSISPTAHYYGGLYYAPGYLLLAPGFVRRLPDMLEQMREFPTRPFDAQRYPAIVEAQKSALKEIDDPAFLERLRRVCACFVSLSLLGVFWTCRVVTGSRWAALAAAAALGSSFELSYHGRWIAVDSALAVFGSLVLGCVCSAVDTATSQDKARRWLRLAAVIAGLGLGCKMPGLFLLVPVLIGVWQTTGKTRLRTFAARALEAGAAMALAFLLTTPGVLLDPLHYANDLYRVESDYNLIADDYPYCEPSVGLRLAKIAGYWGLVLFSPYLGIAVLATGLVVLGAICAVRERQPKLLPVVGFLLVYSSFVAAQRLMLVRNLMVTLPALAVLLAVGASRAAWFLSRFRAGQAAFAGLLLAAGVCNLRFSWLAATEAGRATNDSILSHVEEELLALPHPRLYVSPALRSALIARASLPEAELGSARFEDASEVAMYVDALPSMKANVPRFARYFASPHANFDYYPGLLTWSGLKKMGDPVVVLPKAELLALGVKTAPRR